MLWQTRTQSTVEVRTSRRLKGSQSFSWPEHLSFSHVEIRVANRIGYKIHGGLFFCIPPLESSTYIWGRSTVTKDVIQYQLCWWHKVAVNGLTQFPQISQQLECTLWPWELCGELVKRWPNIGWLCNLKWMSFTYLEMHAPGLYWKKLGVDEKLGQSLLC